MRFLNKSYMHVFKFFEENNVRLNPDLFKMLLNYFFFRNSDLMERDERQSDFCPFKWSFYNMREVYNKDISLTF